MRSEKPLEIVWESVETTGNLLKINGNHSKEIFDKVDVYANHLEILVGLLGVFKNHQAIC